MRSGGSSGCPMFRIWVAMWCTSSGRLEAARAPVSRSASPSCRRRSVRPARASRDGPPRPGSRPRPEAATRSRRQGAAPGPRAGRSRGRRRRGCSRRLRGVSSLPGCPARRRSPRRRVRRLATEAGRPVPRIHDGRAGAVGPEQRRAGRVRDVRARPLDREHPCSDTDGRRGSAPAVPGPDAGQAATAHAATQPTRQERTDENSEGPGLRAFLNRAHADPAGSRYTSAARGRCVSVPGVDPVTSEKRHGKDRSQSRDHARLHRVQAAQLPDQKSKRNTPDRVEFKKYCRWCGTHTPHRETR